jgi:hypothetical protein
VIAMKLQKLIYYSTSVQDLQIAEIEKIIEKAILNNSLMGITGMLLYCSGNFMQVIEGPKDNIQKLMNKILNDKRHYNIIIIQNQSVAKRDFSNWSRGLRIVQPNDLKKYEQCFQIQGDQNDFAIFNNQPSKALDLIRLFVETNKI